MQPASVLQHVPVALEKLLGVVAVLEMLVFRRIRGEAAAHGGYRRVRWDAVADDHLPDTRGRREGNVGDCCFDPVVVVAPRLVSVTMSPVFVDVAAAEIVSDVGGVLPVVLVT